MKPVSIGVLCAAVLGTAIAALVAVGAPDRRTATPPPPPPAPQPARVAANGFALTSVAVTLPEEVATYPDAPHADAMNANCAACHSPAMVLTQPPLTHEQWAATVAKMRTVYRAPIDDAAVPAILAYLDARSASVTAGQGNLPADATRRDEAR
ncbi:MAG TPA: hypothetical protein VM900_09070 [Sphingomonas sp.]|nr:hypothetical protein [Sphingomonas sp.]